METIKNLLRPGGAQDDKTLYNDQTGNTNTTSTGSNLTGEGSHLSGARDGGSHPTSGQGSHFGSANTQTGNETLGSTTVGSGRIGAGQREYDPGSNATSRGINPVGGSSNETYANQQNTTVGPDSTSNSAARTATSDNNRSTELGGITGANSSTHGNHPPQSTSGPHSSDTKNRLDPRVDSDNSRTTHAGTSGVTGNTDRSLTTDNDRSTALGGITGAGSSTHGNHPPNTTSGSHESNRLTSSATGSGADRSLTSDNTHSEALSSGQGGYSSTTGGSHHTGPIGSAVRGPHQTMTANLLDPNLDSSSHRREDAIQHYETQGGGAEKSDHDHGVAPRDVKAGTVGLGALGLESSSNESRFTNQGTSDVQREGHSLADSSMSGRYPGSSSTSAPLHSSSNAQTSSNIPDRTRGTDTTSSHDDSHLGRDAALAGGASGLAGAAYGASHHGDNTQTSSTRQPLGNAVGGNSLHDSRGVGASYPQSSTITDSGSHQSANAPHTSSSLGQTSSTTSTTQPHSSSLLNKLDPRVSNEQTSQTHDTRNAALGAGALGAGGAAYGASRHHDSHDPSNTRDSSTLGSSNVGSGLGQSSNDRTSVPTAGSLGTGSTTTRAHDNQNLSSGTTQTAGPHSSNLGNRLDPSVDSDRSKEKDHNYGRDAALIGAGGAAGYGASRLHDNSTNGNVQDSTSGTYSSDLSNRGANTATSSNAPSSVGLSHQPHTSTTTTTTTNTSTTTAPHTLGKQSKDEHRHHHGKEAAAVGAAGTAAYGAHELSSSRNEDEKLRQFGADERKAQAVEHDKFVAKHGDNDDSHLGRNTAAVGAAGTGAYAAHQLSKDDEKEMLKLREKERANEAKESEKFHEKERKKSESKGGLFSFLHRDKDKKYTKEEEDDFDRQERDYDQQHGAGAGRKAVAASAAGAGAGTYAAHQGHSQHQTEEKPGFLTKLADHLHGTRRNRGVEGDEPFPDGGAPKESINQVTGMPFEQSNVHGVPTIGTDGHHHSAGSTGVLGDSSTSGYPNTTGSTTTGQYDTTGNTTGGLTSGSSGLGHNSNVTDTTTSGLGHNSAHTGLGDNNTSTLSDTTHHERNRLHKDPPAGHPASGI